MFVYAFDLVPGSWYLYAYYCMLAFLWVLACLCICECLFILIYEGWNMFACCVHVYMCMLVCECVNSFGLLRAYFDV